MYNYGRYRFNEANFSGLCYGYRWHQSDWIQCHFFLPEKRQRLFSLLISILQYCWLLPRRLLCKLREHRLDFILENVWEVASPLVRCLVLVINFYSFLGVLVVEEGVMVFCLPLWDYAMRRGQKKKDTN